MLPAAMTCKLVLAACLLLLTPAASAQQEVWSDANPETRVANAKTRSPAV